MNLSFKGALCGPNPPKTIGLTTITSKTFIKGANGEKTIFFELPLANIRRRGGEVDRLKESEERV